MQSEEYHRTTSTDQASILVKTIKTAFSILSPECRGLKIEKKQFDRTSIKLLASIPVKSAHCQVWLMGPSTQLQKVQNAGINRQSLMVKMV